MFKHSTDYVDPRLLRLLPPLIEALAVTHPKAAKGLSPEQHQKNMLRAAEAVGFARRDVSANGGVEWMPTEEYLKLIEG